MSVIKVNTAFKYLLAVGWSQPILIQDTIMSIFPIHIKRQHIGSFKWSGWDNLLPKLVNYPIESQLQEQIKSRCEPCIPGRGNSKGSPVGMCSAGWGRQGGQCKEGADDVSKVGRGKVIWIYKHSKDSVILITWKSTGEVMRRVVTLGDLHFRLVPNLLSPVKTIVCSKRRED